MKSVLFTLSLLFFFVSGHTQLNCDNLDVTIPVIPNCERPLSTDVALFNIMANHYGLKDTIAYSCADRTIEYVYKGEAISDWKYNPKDCGKRFMMAGYKTSVNFKLIASIPTGNNKSIVYEMIRPEKERRKVYFKSYTEDGLLPYGTYVEKNCAGQITVEGEYKLVDKAYAYSYYWYNEETKKSPLETITSNQTSIRSGLWKFYDENGNLINKIKYATGKSDQQNYKGALCGDYVRVKDYQWNYYKDEKIPPGVAIFNDVNAMLGRAMYLSYDVTQRGVVYYLDGQLIHSPFYKSEGTYKPWDYQLEHHTGNLLLESIDNSLNAYTPLGDGHGEMVKFANSTTDIFQMQNLQPEGSFERWNCHGQVIIRGQYKTIDTLYTTTKESFSPETYEETIIVTEHNKATVRSGTWNFYNTEGNHLVEENYSGSSAGSIYSGYMCNVITPESNEIHRTRPNNFLLFNSHCKAFDLPYWLSDDIVLNNKQHYFNGQPIETPTIAYLRNNAEEIKLKTPIGDIKINTKSNDYAAGGTMGRPKEVSFTAVISYPDDQSEVLIFSNNTLTRYESLFGRKNGLYEEKQCNGSYLVTGQYCQVDTILRDTSIVFNPNTYEEEIVITESYVHSKKTGIWKYYDLNGILEKEETFGRCK